MFLGLLVFNVTSYEYFLSSDAADVMTERSIISFLESVAAGDVPPLGGRSISQRVRRILYEVINFASVVLYVVIEAVCSRDSQVTSVDHCQILW